MKKHFWQSRWTFILAAVGSAAGLGNLWRFPFQVYDHGGAVFLVVYFILLLVIGMGLLAGEIVFGQYKQQGTAAAFASVRPWLQRIGWAGALAALVIITYYSAVIGWSLDYLRYSFTGLLGGGLPWAGQASDFFYGTVLQLSEAPNIPGGFSIPVLIGTVITWILIYLFTRKSAHSVGKVVWITATLPFLLLLLLMIRAVTLPGASLGFEFLTQVDRSRITDSSVWIAAAGQIFFSLSIGFGMMIAYASMKPKDSEVMGSAIIVMLGDTLTSVMSAITVFGTMGFMAVTQGVGVTEVSNGGPGLAFVTIPEAITQLPFGSTFFAIIFFATVFFLAIDSAMAMVETGVLAVRDYFGKISNEKLTAIACIVLGAVSLFFVRKNGLYLLDVIDHYNNSYAIIIIAIAEAVVLLAIGKQLVTFIKTRSSKRALALVAGGKLLYVLWGLLIVFLVYTLWANITDGFWVYDSYERDFLKFGVYVTIGLFIVSILLNSIFARRKPLMHTH